MRAALVLAVAVIFGATVRPGPLAGQGDTTSRLTRALPPDVAGRVEARIGEARARGLPADVLTRRALELSAKGVPPAAVESVLVNEASELESGRNALASSGRRHPDDEEVEASATALRRGVSGQQVSELAKAAPSGRSLAVPLFVISSLVDRGLPSDQALERVLARLKARVSDQDIAGLAQAPVRSDQTPRPAGLDVAAMHRGETGRPSWVPANDAKSGRPQNPGQQGLGRP